MAPAPGLGEEPVRPPGESSLGDAKSSLGDAKSSLGDAKSSLGDVYSSGRQACGASCQRVHLVVRTPTAAAGDASRVLPLARTHHVAAAHQAPPRGHRALARHGGPAARVSHARAGLLAPASRGHAPPGDALDMKREEMGAIAEGSSEQPRGAMRRSVGSRWVGLVRLGSARNPLAIAPLAPAFRVNGRPPGEPAKLA
jgi:hypothetical protein